MTFEPNIPKEWGYYWVITKKGEIPKLKSLYPSKNYKNDQRSVEIWECPGIGRSYLDLQNLPRWMWIPVDKPEMQN